MEVTMEADDDLFFADLSRQISLLIMDDDDDNPVERCPSVSFQDFSRANYAATPSPLIFQDQTTYRRESKGTGVFIPQSLHPRRKHNRQGRFTSLNSSKSQKQQQLDNTTRFVSQASYNTANNYFHRKKG